MKLLRNITKKIGLYSYLRWFSPLNRKKLVFYRYFIQRRDLCFDVGANKGEKTEIFLRCGASVIAIEPQDDCVIILRDKFRNNQRVEIINMGLAEESGYRELWVDQSVSECSTMSKSWKLSVGTRAPAKWNMTLKVPVTTLDRLIDQHGVPSYCKIDVEGYEYEVLQGLSHPIRYISFEFTPGLLDPAKACIEYISHLGNYRFNYAVGEIPAFSLGGGVTSSEIISYLSHMQNTLESYGDVYASLQAD